MLEPILGRQPGRVKDALPMPVEPARAPHVHLAFDGFASALACGRALRSQTSRAVCILAARPTFSSRCFARSASRLARRSSRVGSGFGAGAGMLFKPPEQPSPPPFHPASQQRCSASTADEGMGPNAVFRLASADGTMVSANRINSP
jgi:hypothetical protein